MHVLPQTPLDWVLLAVGLATAIIIAVAMQDFFVESRVNNPRIRALQDIGLVFAVSHFGEAYRTYQRGSEMLLPSLARLFAGRSPL